MAMMVLGAITQALPAQTTMSLYEIDYSMFPTVSARFTAFDGMGEPIRGLSASDLTLQENGSACIVTSLSCPPAPSPSPMSLGVLVDAYGHIDLAAAATRRLAQLLAMPANEFGVSMLDHGAYIVQDFTADPQVALRAADGLKSSSGADMQTMFYAPYGGGVPFISGRLPKKTLVLLTDLHCPMFNLDTNRLWKDADRENIRIYTILLHANDHFGYFERIAERTGGRLFERVTRPDQIENILRRIVLESRYEPCVVEWRSSLSCLPTRNVTVSLPSLGAETTAAYTAPANAMPGITVDPAGVGFGAVAAAESVVTLTAHNGPIEVRRVWSDDPHVTIDWKGSLTLAAEERREITVRYTAADSLYRFARIMIESDACADPTVYVSAGTLAAGLAGPTLTVGHPNGGERLTAGADTLITWSGVLPTDSVRLEYSIDRGTSWNTIADRATGLSHRWTVPFTPSAECLARVSHLRPRRTGDDVLTLPEHGHWVSAAAFDRTGDRVATGSYGESMVRVWNTTTGEILTAVQAFSWVNTVEFSPDNSQLLVSDAAGNVSLWDASTGALIRRYLPATNGGVPSARFSPDGLSMVTSGGYDKVARIWDLSSGTIRLTLSGHGGPVQWAAFSPDGATILTASDDGTARLWDARTGAQIRSFVGHNGTVISAAFSADGGHIITGGFDAMANVWDVASGKLILKLAGHTDKLSTVTFSPDGSHAITGSWDRTARIWELRAGTTVKTLSGHLKEVRAAYFSPDGDQVVTASVDRIAKLWNIDLLPVQTDLSDALWTIITPRIELAKLMIDMGNVVLHGSKDSLVKGVIYNRGDDPLHILGVDVTAGDIEDVMIMSGAGDFTLAPGEGRDVVFTFMPMGLGPRQAQVTVRTERGDLRDTIVVRGVGIAAPVEIATTFIDFGRVNVGSTRDTMISVVIRNTGSTPVTVNDLAQLGPDMKQFRTVGLPSRFTLAPNEERGAQLRFAPTAIGRVSGRLAFNYNGPGSPAIVALAGEGTGADVAAPPSLAFANLACGSEIDSTVELYNAGTADLLVTGLAISGRDANDFSIPSSFAPLVVPARTSGRLAIGFHPTTAGAKSALLTIRTNAVDPSRRDLAIPLTGRKDSVGFALSTADLSFGDLAPGARATATMVLTNTGDAPLVWSAPMVVGEFTVESILPATTSAGGTSVVTVRFAGGTHGKSYERVLTLTDGICGRTAQARLSASVSSAVVIATLVAPDVSAAPGEVIDVPIELRESAGLISSGATGVATQIRFNAALLYPVDATPKGYIEGTDRVIPLEIPLTGADRIVATLRFRAALGRDSSTAIMLEKSVPVGADATVTEIPGHFALRVPCFDENPRLFVAGQSIALKQNYPNPARGITAFEFRLIEPGRTRLLITDVRGRQVATILDGDYAPGDYALEVDTAGLAPGTYFYVLETPTQKLSRAMQVDK